MSDLIDQASDFIWRTARVLEQHRFAALFRDAEPEPVALALESYRTPEGGYGFALEPDLRGPVPQPLAAGFALRMLADVDLLTQERTSPLCEHLGRIQRPDGGLPAVHPESPNWPSARSSSVDPQAPGALLSTGSIVGLLLREGIQAPWLDAAQAFCWEAIENLSRTHPYEVESAIVFLDNAPDRPRAERAAERLGSLVLEQELVPLDPFASDDLPAPAGYSDGEHHFAVQYALSPTSLASRWFTPEQLSLALDHLASEQQDDGGWRMRWPDWAPGIAVEWRPVITLDALTTLRAHGRL